MALILTIHSGLYRARHMSGG